MGSRREARALALKTLYQTDVCGRDHATEALRYLEEESRDAEVRTYARALAEGVLEKAAEIDRRLTEAAKNWELDRMAAVDRTVLRIATFEILFRKDVPPPVAVNEAVALAKEYGSEKSGSFVNGVLDGLLKKKDGGSR